MYYKYISKMRKILCKLGMHRYSDSRYICDWAEGDDEIFCVEEEICKICGKKRTHSFYVPVKEYWKKVFKHDGEHIYDGIYRLIVK